MRRSLVLAALAGACMLAAAGTASAAPAPAPQDWTGIWTHTGSINFDPAVSGRDQDNPPYNAAYAPRAKQIRDAEAQGKSVNDRSASCLPPGIVRMMNMVYPMEILQTPGQMTIIAEWMGQIRRVFLDGRPHPPADELDPTFNGHSIGHWEGDTLVVDTVGIKGGGILNDRGAPLAEGDTLHVVERWKMTAPDTLTDTFTIDDPSVFTGPYTAVKTFKRRKDVQIMEYVCAENNRNPVDANGVTGIILQ